MVYVTYTKLTHLIFHLMHKVISTVANDEAEKSVNTSDLLINRIKDPMLKSRMSLTIALTNILKTY